MTEIKLSATDVKTGDVVHTDEYGWAQWDGDGWRAVGPFVIAPDAEGTPTLWHLPDLHAVPVCVTSERVMDAESLLLWPAVVKHFTGSAVS